MKKTDILESQDFKAIVTELKKTGRGLMKLKSFIRKNQRLIHREGGGMVNKRWKPK